MSTSTWKPKIPSDLKYLILHESPGECNTVNVYLPKGYYAMATIGHFLKTSSSKLDLDTETWELNLKPDPEKKDILKNIQKAIDIVRKNKGLIILAGDPDREGEVINYEIVKYFKLKPEEYVRHGNPTSLAEKEYMLGIQKPKKLDMNIVHAGLGRQALDKYVGFLMTQFLWDISSNYKIYLEGIKNLINEKITKFESKNAEILKTNKSVKKIIDSYKNIDFEKLNDFNERKKISFGRVQTVSLILLVKKEFEKFEKELERKINIQAIDSKKLVWEYSRNEELEKDSVKMNQIFNKLNDSLKKKTIKSIIVKDIKSSIKKVLPPDTLDTISAQTDIGNTLGYRLNDTMGALQGLYEGGLTTYMRTDTNATKPDKNSTEISAYEKYIQEMIIGSTKSPFVYRVYRKENAQEGHVGILPTQVYDLNNLKSVKKKDGKGLSEDEFKVFEYVVTRTVAAFMSEAKIEHLTYTLEITLEDGTREDFIIKDSKIIEEGFLEVFKYGIDKYIQKVFYKQGESVDITSFKIREKDIKLPGGYTDISFVKELEKNGIGRPSTYKEIVNTLKDKNYIKVSKDGKIEVTPKGYWVMQVITQDNKQFGRFKDITFTSQMESDLDKIACGRVEKKEILDGIKSEVESIIANVIKKTSSGSVIKGGESFGTCPVCKKGIIEKREIGEKTIYGCSEWRLGCKFIIWGLIAGHVITDDEVKYMIENKESKLITDFISKTGKPFSAKLVFTKGKGFEFEFL